MTERLRLLMLVAGCLALGSIIFVELEPNTADDEAVAIATARPDAPSMSRRQHSLRIDELLTTILARPLFSSSRRPPQSAAAESSSDSDLADARLTGIVTKPGRKIAIFAISGDKPLRVTEGDAVSGWHIENIAPREVSLSGPTGTKTLQPKMDPSLAPPPNQASTGKPGGRLPAPPVAAAAARPPVPPIAASVPSPNPPVPVNYPGALPRPVRPRQQR